VPIIREITDRDYARLLDARTALRRFLHWSGEQAEAVGLTAAQHQLLLAIRGHRGDGPPTIGELADHLLLRHHGAVQLVDRAEAGGWVSRERDPDDHRVVHVQLTRQAARALEGLAASHLQELRQLREAFSGL
jgi:DNA-binding MarR family transcriptional regulator